MIKIIWTDYLNYRAKLRGFDMQEMENIIRYNEIIPVTIHATSRQQVNYRLKSGRFTK